MAEKKTRDINGAISVALTPKSGAISVAITGIVINTRTAIVCVIVIAITVVAGSCKKCVFFMKSDIFGNETGAYGSYQRPV